MKYDITEIVKWAIIGIVIIFSLFLGKGCQQDEYKHREAMKQIEYQNQKGNNNE